MLLAIIVGGFIPLGIEFLASEKTDVYEEAKVGYCNSNCRLADSMDAAYLHRQRMENIHYAIEKMNQAERSHCKSRQESASASDKLTLKIYLNIFSI